MRFEDLSVLKITSISYGTYQQCERGHTTLDPPLAPRPGGFPPRPRAAPLPPPRAPPLPPPPVRDK
jgi:hypothetical protein